MKFIDHITVSQSWSLEDVLEEASNMNLKLTSAQALQVLENAVENFNVNLGFGDDQLRDQIVLVKVNERNSRLAEEFMSHLTIASRIVDRYRSVMNPKSHPSTEGRKLFDQLREYLIANKLEKVTHGEAMSTTITSLLKEYEVRLAAPFKY